jgi:hypothetical protein
VFQQSLVWALDLFDSPEPWSITTRNEMLEQLERCARFFETHAPRRLKNADPLPPIGLSEIFACNAAGFRELKPWVLLPQRQTKADLQAELAAAICHCVDGHWHYLRRGLPIARRRRHGAILLIFRAIRILIGAALPVAVVQLWHISAFSPSQAVYQSLIVSAFCLGAIYLLLSFDPDAVERIKSASAVVGIITGDKR